MRRPPLTRRLLIIPAVAATALAPAAAMADSIEPTPTTAAKKPLPNKIVLGRSIGGISLGMSSARVKQRLGKPMVLHGKGNGPSASIYLGPGLVITFVHHKAASVGTTKSRFRTPAGIHIGSTLSTVRQTYPKVRCKHLKVGKLKLFNCSLASGSNVTDFTMNVSGRAVETIDVSRR